MATFLTNLWESIFTPGPTPTLLLATNATFGALQLLLLILFVATQSIHFIILSVLCGGLWYAINWFAEEVQAAQAKDEAEKKQATRKSPRVEGDSDTETEMESKGRSSGLAAKVQRAERRKAAPADLSSKEEVKDVSGEAGASFGLLRPGSAGTGANGTDRLQRQRSMGESSGDISTDSEWEKVSDQEGKQ